MIDYLKNNTKKSVQISCPILNHLEKQKRKQTLKKKLIKQEKIFIINYNIFIYQNIIYIFLFLNHYEIKI